MIITTTQIFFWNIVTTLMMSKARLNISQIKDSRESLFSMSHLAPQTHRGHHIFIWGEVYDHNHHPDTFLEHCNNSNDT